MNTNLKSKEEWETRLRDTRDSKGQVLLSAIEWNQDIIKQIQLNAYKAGMTEAAEICWTHKNNALGVGFASQFDCRYSILSARDRKESL